MPPPPQRSSLFSDLPRKPGVYLMKNRSGRVLYIGKAKDLKSRVSQYFQPGRDGRMMVPYLTSQVTEIKTIIVHSEKEALLLENTLIKEHQPKYNALLKDDKSFFALMINHKNPWPMLKIVRYKGKVPAGSLYFGPYTKSTAARKTLELLRSLFPLRQCSDHELASRTRPCILYDLKRCIAPCVNKCSKSEYELLVDKVISFLKGNDKKIASDLKSEMKKAADALDFERADKLYKLLQAIEETLEKQKVEKLGGGDFDVIDFVRSASAISLALLQYRNGKLISCGVHLFQQCAQDDSSLLSSFILQHYEGLEERPHELLLPLALEEQQSLEKLLHLKIITPKKGRGASLLKLAKENAAEKIKSASHTDPTPLLVEMEERFTLTHLPERIECFDHSHLSGSEAVCSMVVFTDGVADRREYRKYKISAADDYGAMREVLTRRFKKSDKLPDLVMIDGGKGHLSVAQEVFNELNISTVDLLAIAKEKGRHDKGMTQEQIFLPSQKEPILLPATSKLLFLLQQIRDEAHRFAISFHKSRRKKRLLSSALDEIPGIGPIKKKRLLTHFGSVERMLQADAAQWREIPGITQANIEALTKMQQQAKEEE